MATVNTNKKTITLVQTALLTAVTILLAYMPMKVGAIEMTLRMIPVVLGGIIMGPWIGAFLGGIFGLTSLFECLGILGIPLSAFGSLIIGISPLRTIITVFVPRILMGFLSALIFRAIFKLEKNKHWFSYLVSNISGALLNTVLFTSATLLLFSGNTEFTSTMSVWGIQTGNVWLFVVAFVGLNGIIEAAVCAFAGTAISKGVFTALSHRH